MSEELIMMGWLFSRVTSLTVVRWTLYRLMDINCIKYETRLPELINGVLIIIKCLFKKKQPTKQTAFSPPNPQNKTRGGGDAVYQNKAGLD